jgi:hypothetical protein
VIFVTFGAKVIVLFMGAVTIVLLKEPSPSSASEVTTVGIGVGEIPIIAD